MDAHFFHQGPPGGYRQHICLTNTHTPQQQTRSKLACAFNCGMSTTSTGSNMPTDVVPELCLWTPDVPKTKITNVQLVLLNESPWTQHSRHPWPPWLTGLPERFIQHNAPNINNTTETTNYPEDEFSSAGCLGTHRTDHSANARPYLHPLCCHK